ncbi:MAG: GAF domain-containing protein [Hansschlegelia sp.]
MAKTDKDILTTAETAKLVGVSVRTAQLLIEGGTIASWKTPGGHRRVYRSDVMALIEGGGRAAPPLLGATVVIIGAAERLAIYDRLFAGVAECAVETFEDVLAALVAIGALKPRAVVVDVEASATDRSPLLHSLASNPSLGDSWIVAAGAAAGAPQELPKRIARVETAEEAVAAIRKSLSDVEGVTPPDASSPFPVALNERQRLVALERSGLLDTAPEEAFDRLTWLAAQSLNAPIALLTLLTPSRQWFKSRVGLDLAETPRSWAFCNHTIMQKRVFSVDDLASDPRFADNPAVIGEDGFRFYAGAPVLDEDGFVIGSLCVIDHKPRTLDERESQTMQALAALASGEVRLRALDRRLREALRGGDRNRAMGGHAPQAKLASGA